MFVEVFLQAVDSIKSNKMRTFLTMLGVVIGVSSVIMIFSAGNAGKAYINGIFGKLGANIINVATSATEQIEETDMFTLRDVEYLKSNINEITTVQYYGSNMSGNTSVNYGDTSKMGIIMGIIPTMFDTRPMELSGGRLLNQNDIDCASNVALIPDMCVKGLFGNFNPIGKKVVMQDSHFGSKTLTIVGTIDFDIGMDMTMDEASDKMPGMLIIPFSTYQNFYQRDTIEEIELVFPKDVDSKDVADKAKRYLELLHNTKDKYTFTSSQQIQDTVNTVINVIQIAILAIGAISLVVGGIGIMNIMLVAVTERTREIGIRKAIGAQKRDIIIQFLVEAVLLTLMSGVVGIIIGIIPSFPLSVIAKCSPSELVSPSIILVSIGVAVLCGIFFGVYPAKKAADLDPIESLRYE